jgi:putative ABC transport system substrate-binding protein
VKRRDFIALVGGAAATWPLTARAQQQRVRRIGVLVGWEENNFVAKRLLSMLTQRLQELGWTEGSNIRLDVRWAAGNVDRMQIFAKELVGLGPDVILASTTPVIAALHHETRTVPIVFLYVSDPIGAGFVASLSRPGTNITGINNL